MPTKAELEQAAREVADSGDELRKVREYLQTARRSLSLGASGLARVQWQSTVREAEPRLRALEREYSELSASLRRMLADALRGGEISEHERDTLLARSGAPPSSPGER